MIQISSIEIYYFRSIYRLHLKNMNHLNIFSGKNDYGKSNILKALNLFFNNETDWKVPIDFTKDYSIHRRDQVTKETIKGRQFIQITLGFLRGERAVTSLPDKFYVTKTWYRYSKTPDIKTTIEYQFKKGEIKTKSLDRSQAGLQRYINKIRFEYIPAVKDRRFYTYSLGLLQDIVLQRGFGGADIKSIIKKLNEAVEQQTTYLRDEYNKVINVETNIVLPEDLSDLFRAFSIATSYGGNNEVPLSMRGDGIQARFLPSLLHYITERGDYWYIWGFEEPENCLEHSLASTLADDLRDKYCKNAQIFLTTHSPALISSEGSNISSWRVFLRNNCTEATQDISELQTELGITELYKKHEQEIRKLKEENLKLRDLSIELKKSDTPILLTEGLSDVIHLESALYKLFPDKLKDFRIIKSDPYDDGENSAGGTGMLRKALESCRQDLPLTIGLFDRDKEGIKEFNNLDSNFISSEDGDYKIHKNKHTAAFLLPVPDEKKHFEEANNFPIEYLFSEDDILKKSTDGKGLKFSYGTKKTILGDKLVNEESINTPNYRKVVGGKVYFAKNIAANFQKESFNHFALVFTKFEDILKILKV